MNNNISTEKCYLCGTDTKVLYEFNLNPDKTYYILKCMDCNLMRTFPIPEKSEIKRFYSSKVRPSVFENGEVFNSRFLEKIKEIFIIRPMLNKLYGLFKNKRGPRLLDIGCSTGWITSIARNIGFNVKGLESNSKSANIAREKYGLEIIEGFIEDLDLDEKFDVIVMMHVLEHFTDPIDTLTKVNDLLSENGKLLIVVPNGESLGTEIFMENYNWNVPRHLSFFTKNSMNLILAKSQFRIRNISALSSPPLILYSLGNYINNKKHPAILKFIVRNPIIGNIVAFPLAFVGKLIGKPEVIAIYAEKI
ncbi:MAG: methyltransferase domain-containing protein [Candidatus Dadabacteria bacterium]|nr:methyltransferase domain-containing protein [Candidatus Dadabacteria bacterium]